MSSVPSNRLTHRFTAALADPAYDAMVAEMALTGATQNEVINHALLLLSRVRDAQQNGSLIYQPSDGSPPHHVLII